MVLNSDSAAGGWPGTGHGFLEPHCERLGHPLLSPLKCRKKTTFPDTKEQKDILSCPRVK